MKKAIILDTGSLITLSMSGLLYLIPELKKKTGVRFAITEKVKYEILDRPLSIPRFQLGALRIQNLVNNKDIELPKDLGISSDNVKKETQNLLHVANHSVQAKQKWIKIVSDAEMSCLALSALLKEKGIDNLIAVDERTTRILAEKPENLEKIMSRKLHFNVKLVKKNFDIFKEFKFIRSTELAYVAYKKGLLKVKGPKALEAALYATKYKGSSVSHDEIKVLKKL